MTRSISLLIGLLFLVTQSFAQPITVSATLDSTRMMIGDQMKLHLMVNHQPGVRILNTDLSKLESSKEIEVIQSGKWDTLQQGVEFVLQQDLVFSIYDSGAFFIPVIPFTYQQNGQTRKISTNELLVEVSVPALVDTMAFEPNYGIIEEPFKFEDLIPILLTIGGLLLLGGLLFYFYKKSQNKVAPPTPIIIIPAHEIALKKLAELKAAKLWQQGKIKEYQSQLTFIVREYLENRYAVQALESTTNEILTQLNPIAFSKDWKQKLREMLQLADLVKFAKAEPPVETHDKLMKYAEDFVLKTKKVVVVSEDIEEA